MLPARSRAVTTESVTDLLQLAKKSLKTRYMTPELMDDPGLERWEHLRALRALGRINWLSRAAQLLAREVERILRPFPDRTIRVLDIACGGGDIVFSLQRLLQNRSIQAEIDGCDVSPVAIDLATSQAEKSGSRARFFCRDVFEGPLPNGYDLLISSLFLHHLQDEEIVPLLQRMADSVERGFVISDLERSKFGYWLAYLASRVLTRSSVVRVDSLRSVRSALTLSELERYMLEAGLKTGRVYHCFPCRLMFSWRQS